MEENMRQLFQLLEIFAIVILAILPVLAVVFVYIAIKRKLLKKIEYRRYFSCPGAFQGEEISLVEEITNRSGIPLFRVNVEFLMPEGLLLLDGEENEIEENQEIVSSFFLKAHTTIRRTYKVVCEKRGFYQLESAGILYAREMVYLDSKATVYVYPLILPVEETNRLELFLQNQDASRKPLVKDLFSFSGIRDYEKGDSFHSINFKATARYGSLKVNNTDFLAGKRQMIYVNFQPSSNAEISKNYRHYMEKALSYSAYLLDNATFQGYQIGFAANSRMVNGDNYVRYPMSRGGFNYEEILKELASIRMSQGNSLASVLEFDIRENLNHTEIYVMTIVLDERAKEKLDILEQMDNCVNIIYLPVLEEGF